MNIILADDDPLVIETLGEFLRKSGHTVFATTDLRRAVEEVFTSDGKIDVFIMDIDMLSGSESDDMRVVKARYPAIDLVTMTSLPVAWSAAHAQSLDACAFLRKPIHLAEMTIMLKRTEKYRRSLNLLTEAAAHTCGGERV